MNSTQLAALKLVECDDFKARKDDKKNRIYVGVLPFLSELLIFINICFPVEDFPRNGSPPIMRTLSGFPAPYEPEIHFGCPPNMTEDAVVGWVLLLMGLHPASPEELASMEKASRALCDAYKANTHTNVLRPLWHLVAN